MDNFRSLVTYQTRSVLVCQELRNLSSIDFTLFCRPSPDFLTGIILRVTTRGVRDFDFLEKGTEKGFPEKLLYA